MAERVGFEPTVPSLVHLISSQGRYNHFDTAPRLLANQNIAIIPLQAAFVNPEFEKSGEHIAFVDDMLRCVSFAGITQALAHCHVDHCTFRESSRSAFLRKAASRTSPQRSH